MKKILLLSYLILMLPVSAQARDAATERVDMSKLAEKPDSFLGKHVQFHGCLVSARPHGEFVRPCRSQSRDLVIVSDDTFGNKGPFSALFDKSKTTLLNCVQANFSGLVVTSEVIWPRKRRETTIELTSFSGVARCST